MQLIDLSNAFSAPIKDKDAPLKVGLFFGVNLFFGLALFAMSFFMNYAEDSNQRGLAGIISLLFCFGYLIVVIVLSIFNSWYTYEYTSAAIEKRNTVALWNMDFGTSLKRSLKLVLLNIIYNIPVAVIYCCILFLFYMLFFGALIGTAGLAASSYDAESFRDPSAIMALLSGFSVGLLVYCCVIIALAIANFMYQILIVLPAQLNLIRTHTFNNGLNVGENWSFMRKHFSEFLKFLMVQLAIGLIGIFLYFVFYFLSIIIIGIPLLILLVLVALYYQAFAYPTLTGDFYRKLRERNV